MSINRRDFLKLFGLGTGAAALSSCAPANKLANKLSDELTNYSWEKTPKISTLQQASEQVHESLSKLSGIDNGQVIVCNGDEANKVQFGQNEESILPFSSLKPAICYEFWKLYPNLLTPEIANEILGENSGSTHNLLMNSPLSIYASESESTEPIIRMLLENTDARLTSPNGEQNLQVNFQDYFQYLHDSEFPEIIQNAMRQTTEVKLNYGVEKILAYYLDLENTPVYFKLGMNMMGENQTGPLALSYFFQTRDIQAYGYVFGSGCENMVEQMRCVAATVGSFTASH